MENENKNKQKDSFFLRRAHIFTRSSADVSAASIAILKYMQRNSIPYISLKEIIALDTNLAKEISKIQDKLPQEFSLEYFNVAPFEKRPRDLIHIENAVKRKLAPLFKGLSIGEVEKWINEHFINVNNVAVVSDNIAYSERLANYKTVVHYFMNKNDDLYTARKIMLLSMMEDDENDYEYRYRCSMFFGDDFLAETQKKFDVIVIEKKEDDDSALLEKAKTLLSDGGKIFYGNCR